MNSQAAFVRLERAVASRGPDFSATYMLVGRLGEMISDDPACASTWTVRLLADLMADRSFSVHKQSYFLYRSVAETLAAILVRRSCDAAGRSAMDSLKRVAEGGGGNRQRAAAEALGSLPVTVSGPGMQPVRADRAPAIAYPHLLAKKQLDVRRPPALLGRSLVAPLADGERVFVVKLARDRSDRQRIGSEASWMDYLTGCGDAFTVPFHIPRPLTVGGCHVFRITHLPVSRRQRKKLPPLPCCAMGYIARCNYFAYPNDHRPGNRVDTAAFSEIIFRNARLLGRLTAMGIVHTAPIALFHNRIQRARRGDHGIYQWHRGGRLDRWLHSCRYPNFGMSGLRDFEHLRSLGDAGPKLYRYIGDHLLSLLLVAGSYFRHAAPDRFGTAGDGRPLDVRRLFDRDVLARLVRGIFANYYHGFTSERFSRWMHLAFGRLADRMIEEMGVDRHMEEVLRVADQRRMSDGTFADFLKQGGFSDRQIRDTARGDADIHIRTGPHLGAFNGRISLPEMTVFLASAAACCIAGRYCHQAGNRSTVFH